MLNRGRNVSSNAFKTVSILLWFSAFVLLFGCWVKCDLVGHGRHELRDGKIEKLMVNTMIAETPEDLEQYKKLPGACDVEMDKDGNIIIWYLKHSKTKEDGCSADFVTTKHDSFLLEFGIWHTSELSDCLDFAGGTGDKADSLENYATLNENRYISNISSYNKKLFLFRVGFSFSLKGSEFDRIKNGPLYGNDDDCTDGEMCKFGKGKCLKAADYSIGWARIKENIVDSLQASKKFFIVI
ncbi:unnamed protein product [Meloidogyne enterolobii]|uniref:Uncharacterized protein n=1 Tax=Meloidogyne enterolobii TaxID=390850 RepID=A0ACB0ZJW7_MELEN